MEPAGPPQNQVLDRQARMNRSTRANWESFASHRAKVFELLVPDIGPAPAGGSRGRLCVLGAGNCNDLDLKALLEAFAEIHLVDLDAAAVAQAVRRQGVESAAVRIHAPVDLTGVADVVSSWHGRKPSSAEVDACVARSDAAAMPPLPGPFDTVLSPCVLSQLCGYATDSLGQNHPRFTDLLLAIRRRHLRLMVDLLAPGGAAVLVSDMASSDAVDELKPAAMNAPGTRRADLPGLMMKLTYGRGHYPGLSPPAVESALRGDPLVAPLLGHVQLVPPWVWRLGPGRSFLVYALRFRRLAGPRLLGPTLL